MASSGFYTIANALFFYSFVQNIIPRIEGNECVPPKFKPDQKILVEYFYDAGNGGLDIDSLCKIIKDSNGLISMEYRMGAEVERDSNGELNCGKCTDCDEDRRLACYYQQDADFFNNCDTELPQPDEPWVADCISKREADDLLVDNGTARQNYGIEADQIPTMVVDGKYDKCFDFTNFDTMKQYFCTAYENVLPVCTK